MRLSMRETWRAALATYRAHPVRVLGIALVLLVPVEALGGLGRWAQDHLDHRQVGTAVFLVLIAFLGTIATSLGSAFYAGILDHTVHADRHGSTPPPVVEIVRRVPHWRVIGVSVLSGLLVAIGFVLLVVPGLILMTLFSIAAPVLVIEDLGVRAALRRSAALVRPQFWAVVLVVTLPLLLESTVIDAIASVVGHSWIAEAAIHGLLSTALIALVMLLEVHAAHWLIEHDPPVVAEPVAA